MAVCDRCNCEMNEADSCISESIAFGSEEYAPIPFGQETRFRRQPAADERCHDCGVVVGGVHHEGCDMEECPRCHGQLFSCDCWAEFGDEDDDEI